MRSDKTPLFAMRPSARMRRASDDDDHDEGHKKAPSCSEMKPLTRQDYPGHNSSNPTLARSATVGMHNFTAGIRAPARD